MIIDNTLIKHVNNKQQRGDLKLWLATRRVIFTTKHESKVSCGRWLPWRVVLFQILQCSA